MSTCGQAFLDALVRDLRTRIIHAVEALEAGDLDLAYSLLRDLEGDLAKWAQQ